MKVLDDLIKLLTSLSHANTAKLFWLLSKESPIRRTEIRSHFKYDIQLKRADDQLRELGLMKKRTILDVAYKPVEYRLTKKGKAIKKILKELTEILEKE
jgi:DNA-binding HxlR family transcriptional regulator